MSRRQFTAPTPADAEPPDDTGCTVLHVDMDAFYASASLIARPELRGHAGHHRRRERPRRVVLSATYEARAFGVTSAMPMARARRLCPQAVIIEPDHRRYAAISEAVMATFAHDHRQRRAALARRGLPRRRRAPYAGSGVPAQIAEQLRDTVADEQGITCSVGVASTKFVAKLASNLAKPDGLIVVPREEVVSFLHQLPVGAIWGVGDKTEEHLHRLGLRTVADIAHTPVETLQRALGDVAGRSLHDARVGPRPPVRRAARGARSRSAPTRPSPTTSTTRSASTASCCASPTGPPPGPGPPG